MTNEKQMGLDCIELIQRKLEPGRMTREEYYNALIELHNKYPMAGHNPPLTSYQIEHWREIKEIVKDPHLDVMYLDHLQPWNFMEAAEMYKRSLDKRDRECLPLTAWRKRAWPLTKQLEPREVRDHKVEASGEMEDAPF